MSDPQASAIEEEVAFFGDQGCTLNHLLSIMQQDNNRKARDEANSVDTDPKQQLWKILKGLASLKYETQNVDAPAINLHKITWKRFKSICDMNGRCVMEEKSRQAIITKGIKSGSSLTKNTLPVLEKIAMSRGAGITQAALSADMNLDTRAVFSYVKRLEEVGLVVRRPIVERGKYTRICHHIRFNKDETKQQNNEQQGTNCLVDADGAVRHDAVRAAVINTLQQAENGTLPMTKLLASLNFTSKKHIKWTRGFLKKMEENGLVTHFKVVGDSSRKLCIRLLSQHADSANVENLSPVSQDDMRTPSQFMSGDVNDTTEHPTLIDGRKPTRDTNTDDVKKKLDERILDEITKSRSNGVTRKDLEILLPDASPFTLRSVLKRIRERHSDKVTCGVEFMGRARQYRYFAVEHASSPVMQSPQQPHAITSEENNTYDDDKNQGSNRSEQNGSMSSCPSYRDILGTSTGKRPREAEPGEDLHIPKRQTLRADRPSGRKRTSPDELMDKSDENLVKRQRGGMKGANLTVEKRKQALRDIVSRDRIRQVDKSLADDLVQATGESITLKRKAVLDVAHKLMREKELRLMNTVLTGIDGTLENIAIVVRTDMGEDDERIKRFVDQLRSDRLIKPQHKQLRPVPVIQAKDDEERYPLTEKQLRAKELARQRLYNAPGRYWSEVALRYGWLKSKWRRAKVLHEFIFGQMLAGDPQNWTFNAGKMLACMPFRVYRQLIGIFVYDEVIEEFLKSMTDNEVAISKLPPHIWSRMAPKRYKIRNNYVSHLNILVALELLAPVPGKENTFRVLRTAPVKNYNSVDRPVLRTFTLDTMRDLHDFWDDLEFDCTCTHTRGPGEAPIRDCLRAISMAATWNPGSFVTAEQRHLLDAYISNGKAPAEDSQLVAHLSKQARLSQSRIKRYYDGLEYVRTQQKKQMVRTRKRPRSVAVRELIEAAQTRRPVPTAATSSPPPFPYTRGKITVARQRLPTSASPAAQVKTLWTDDEESALIHAYAIMLHRAKKDYALLCWKPILQVVRRGKDIHSCRNKIYALKQKQPELKNELDQLQKQWSKIYALGIASGELVDERPWDCRDFDLVKQLQYFILSLQKEDISADLVSLPQDIRTALHQYNVIQYRPRKRKPWIYDMPETLDTATEENGLALVSVVIKSILMTPATKYDPRDARNILRRYPAHTVEEAANVMRRQGVITKHKTRTQLNVPGRFVHIGKRFLRIFHPKAYNLAFYKEAKSVMNMLQQDDCPLRPDMSLASFLAMLHGVSQNTTEVQLRNKESSLAVRKNLHQPKLAQELLCMHYVFHGFDIVFQHVSLSESRRVDLPLEERGPSVDEFRGNAAEDVSKVLDVITSFGERGATYSEVKLKICSDQGMMTPAAVMQCIQLLLHEAAPRVIRAGFHEERLVAATHAGRWQAASAMNKVYTPVMWRDIQGDVIPDVLHGCACSLLDTIIQNPGITRSTLYQRYHGHLSHSEVVLALDYLMEERRAIRACVFATKTRRTFLWGNRRQAARALDKGQVDEHMMTHYWAEPDFYLKL
ncbi:hypothetical protein BCR43DRAFT_523554 [Syncephalastrum racemosum]|uniref:Uncharacterized protein n=1 Tax=Syncephalastrum racemosum TaxID=13706 RepID=A0A1X2HEI8_SYNRA|nr:hypothetical protein BCR43DRAFT_523554 [Syncephalastrum racemosum]